MTPVIAGNVMGDGNTSFSLNNVQQRRFVLSGVQSGENNALESLDSMEFDFSYKRRLEKQSTNAQATSPEKRHEKSSREIRNRRKPIDY